PSTTAGMRPGVKYGSILSGSWIVPLLTQTLVRSSSKVCVDNSVTARPMIRRYAAPPLGFRTLCHILRTSVPDCHVCIGAVSEAAPYCDGLSPYAPSFGAGGPPTSAAEPLGSIRSPALGRRSLDGLRGRTGAAAGSTGPAIRLAW